MSLDYLLSLTPLLSSYVRRLSGLLTLLCDVGTTGGRGATTATEVAAVTGAPLTVAGEGDVVLPPPVDVVIVLANGGGELLLLLLTAVNEATVLLLELTTATIGGVFSASGLLGIRSYMRLPSAAFGGFGKNSTSGFGMFSLAVRRSHSLTTGPGFPRRSAMCVTLPRFFFL